MSLFDEEAGMKNPAKKFIKWKSTVGFYYYDKDVFDEEKQKQGKDIVIPKFNVIPLKEYATITGYHKKSKSGIWSNEINPKESKLVPFKVFAGKAGNDGKPAVIAEGLYDDIKGNLVLLGGKWTKSAYAMLIMRDGSTELVNIHVSGGGKNAFEKALETKGQVVTLSTDPVQVKGDLGYYTVPLVEVENKVDSNLVEKAKEHYAELKTYMDWYLNKNSEDSERSERPNEKSESSEQVVKSEVSEPANIIDDSLNLPF